MISTLAQIIFPGAVLPIAQQPNQERILVVKENDPKSAIYKLKIKDVPDESFAFTLDHKTNKKDKKRYCFTQISAYLHPENGEGINKGCDAVLITYYENHWYALILDLKSDKPDIPSTEKQLRNSELFVKYLCTLIENFYREVTLHELTYKHVYITTRMKNNATYHPNNLPPSCKGVSVKVDDQRATTVHLGKLLGV